MFARLALTVIAGFLLANSALAQSSLSQSRAARMDRHFSYTDKNGSGFIERDEAAVYPALIKHFGRIDSNKDGKVSKDEMQAYRLGTHAKQHAAKAGKASGPVGDQSNSALSKADSDDANARTH